MAVLYDARALQQVAVGLSVVGYGGDGGGVPGGAPHGGGVPDGDDGRRGGPCRPGVRPRRPSLLRRWIYAVCNNW